MMMLATISFDEPDEKAACRRALEAAVEASINLKSRNLERDAAGLPFADVDIALCDGEVLYGNVGAADRLDFTVIGPAVNEVVRMEKLCEPLNRQILFSSRFADAAVRRIKLAMASSFLDQREYRITYARLAAAAEPSLAVRVQRRFAGLGLRDATDDGPQSIGWNSGRRGGQGDRPAVPRGPNGFCGAGGQGLKRPSPFRRRARPDGVRLGRASLSS